MQKDDKIPQDQIKNQQYIEKLHYSDDVDEIYSILEDVYDQNQLKNLILIEQNKSVRRGGDQQQRPLTPTHKSLSGNKTEKDNLLDQENIDETQDKQNLLLKSRNSRSKSVQEMIIPIHRHSDKLSVKDKSRLHQIDEQVEDKKEIHKFSQINSEFYSSIKNPSSCFNLHQKSFDQRPNQQQNQSDQIEQILINNQQLQQGYKPKIFQKIKILIEGWVQMKEEDGIFSTWIKRYAILTEDIIYFYIDSSKAKKTHSFNFLMTQTLVSQFDKNIIQLDIKTYKKQFFIKIIDEGRTMSWFTEIKRAAGYNRRGYGILFLEFNRYQFSDVMTEREFLQIGETGDIILLETDHIGALIQRKITNSLYDHVGMVVRLGLNDLRIYDSNTDTGVSLVPWDIFIEENDLYCRASIRKLYYSEKYDLFPIFMSLIGETLGKKYHITLKQLLKKKSNPKKSTSDGKKKESKGYFCSQLVAKMYKRIGLLPQQISSCQFLPVTFSEQKNLKLLKGAKLGFEQTVVLDRHRKIILN